MHLRRIYKLNNPSLIDEAMLVYFPSQHSYNQEEIFELHLHGSRAVVNALFKELQKLQMRMA